MKILVTGFDPFGGETVNPSYEAAKGLPDRMGAAEIIKLELPTRFDRAGDVLTAALEQHRPQVVICLGQAGGRGEITPERVAINIMDTTKPDNAGQQPTDIPICPNGPAAYFSTLPIKSILRRLEQESIPARISNTAGTFVCNAVMYTLLHWIANNAPDTRGGFVHVPYIPEQAQGKSPVPPSMELSAILQGLHCMLDVCIAAWHRNTEKK